MDRTNVCEDCGAELPTDTTEGLCPRCLLGAAAGLCSSGVSPASSPSVPLGETSARATLPELAAEDGRATHPRRFGNYELLEQIASGGMGIVYKARQIRLNRIVAIKTLPFGRFTRETFVKRFEAEAAAAARLRHPNIVAIHEVGEHEGQPYFSMDYVDGQNLAEITRDQPIAIQRAVRFLRTIAEAVQYAHSMGILHRDLKPSNILIDALDQPHITDFGLAKDLKSDSELTLTGQTLGSPNYIPPEQIDGRGGNAGPHSDVYSLGAVLYHLLTGRPPFVGESVTATLQQVASTDPVASRLLNPSVPRDLETICLKCLEKEPGKRYRSAQELSDELGRWQRNEHILARSASPAEVMWKWCKRKPALAALSAVVMLLLIALAGGSSAAAWRIRAEQRRAEQISALLADLLVSLQNRENEQSKSWRLLADPGTVRILAVSESSNLLLLASNNIVIVSNTQMHRAVSGPFRHETLVSSAQFSPDSKRFVTTCADPALNACAAYVWETHTGRLISTRKHVDGVSSASFSPDGTQVVTGGEDHYAYVWDAQSGNLLTPALRHQQPIKSVLFSPDGRRIISVLQSNKLQIWDAKTGQPLTPPI